MCGSVTVTARRPAAAAQGVGQMPADITVKVILLQIHPSPHLTLQLPRHPSVILPGISSSQQSVPFSFWFVYCHIAIARTLKLATPVVYFCLYIYTLVYSQVYEVFTRNINFIITTLARILKAAHDCFMLPLYLLRLFR